MALPPPPTVRIVLNKTKQIWKPTSKLSDNSLNKTKQIWKPKGKLSDNSLSKTQRVWKATGKLFADIVINGDPKGKKLTLGKLDCGYQWRPTGKKFCFGENMPVVQVMLWYLDSWLLKQYDGNRFNKLMNFVEKFIGVISQECYYVEGLGHNLFSVGQFCDSDLEVAFRKHTCFVRDLNGTDILKGSRGTNLYTISIDEMMKSSPICLLSKASKPVTWKKQEVLPHGPNLKIIIWKFLHTPSMDLCGPMRVQSIKGKKYILVIVDDYSRFTWVGLNKTVRFIRTDNGTEFVNLVMSEYYESVGIFHQKSVPRTPQQNGVVERRNRTLVEAARTMMIFSKAPMFLWAEVVATACYTQNRSLIHTRWFLTAKVN
ncbi:integrase, catalytic region, zinc finger, CCHC-type containing protein [Tanacetum coccineum]